MRSYKPVVGFDIDGVLANFTHGFTRLAVVAGQIKEPHDQHDVETWDFPFHVDPVWALVDKSRVFWEGLPPLFTPEDLEAIWALHLEATIIYVTSRSGPANVGNQTMNWLTAMELPEGPLMLAKSGRKSELLKPMEHHLLAFLDDSPKEVAAMAEANVPVYVRDWKYNKGVEVPRVSSIAEFVDRLGVKVMYKTSQLPEFGQLAVDFDWSEADA